MKQGFDKSFFRTCCFFRCFAVFMAFALTSCMQHVNSNVTRFHDPQIFETEKNFVILPFDAQEGSLEYKQYAALISKKLEEYGYKEVESKTNADYAVYFDYGIDSGQTVVSSYPIYGSTGGGTTYHTGSVSSYGGYGTSSYSTYGGTSYTPSTFGVVGSGTTTSTVYTRILSLDILDLEKSNKSNIVKAFEGKVTSAGSTGDFATVSQCLIDALFQNFPGENGKTEKISLPSNSCMIE